MLSRSWPIPVTVKLEGPQPQPYIYPNSQRVAKIVSPPDYRLLNFNYLIEYAQQHGAQRDRIPLYTVMKKSPFKDPFTGYRIQPLPAILFDMIGQPAGYGVPVSEAYSRGPIILSSLIGGDDHVLPGYRFIDVTITIEWPGYLRYRPFVKKFTIGEGRKHRLHMLSIAAQAIAEFLKLATQYRVDPADKYWECESASTGNKAIGFYNLNLVALVNTHENFWRVDLAALRPVTAVQQRGCMPTMLDPVTYQFHN